jgi:hypothetical protein
MSAGEGECSGNCGELHIGSPCMQHGRKLLKARYLEASGVRNVLSIQCNTNPTSLEHAATIWSPMPHLSQAAVHVSSHAGQSMTV